MTEATGSVPPVALAVIIPARNAAETLPRQIHALAGSEIDGTWEVVVVDNGSTDATAQAARTAAEETNLPLRVIVAGERLGPSYARNRGVAATTAPRLLFCDADDEVRPGWVARLNAHLDEAPVVTGRLRSDTLNDPMLAASRGPDDRPPTFFGLFPSVGTANMGVRREAWVRVGPFDETLPAIEDAEWAARAKLAGIDVAWAPDAVVDYRFRTEAGALWRQGRRYGRYRPLVARRWYQATGERCGRFEGGRSWLWLVVHLLDLRSRAGRARWAWVAGNRVGAVIGSIRYRFLVL